MRSITLRAVRCGMQLTLHRTLLVTGVVIVAGCHSWRQAPPNTGIAPPMHGTGEERAQLRVTRTDGRVVKLSRAAISHDSVTGWVALPPPPGTPGGSDYEPKEARLAISGDSVRRIDVRHFDAGKTVGLGLGLTAAATAALFGISYAVWASSGLFKL